MCRSILPCSGKAGGTSNPQLLTPGLRGKCTFFVKPSNNSPSVSGYTQQMFSRVLKRPLKRRVLHYLKLQLCNSAVPSLACSLALVPSSSFFFFNKVMTIPHFSHDSKSCSLSKGMHKRKKRKKKNSSFFPLPLNLQHTFSARNTFPMKWN